MQSSGIVYFPFAQGHGFLTLGLLISWTNHSPDFHWHKNTSRNISLQAVTTKMLSDSAKYPPSRGEKKSSQLEPLCQGKLWNISEYQNTPRKLQKSEFSLPQPFGELQSHHGCPWIPILCNLSLATPRQDLALHTVSNFHFHKNPSSRHNAVLTTASFTKDLGR